MQLDRNEIVGQIESQYSKTCDFYLKFNACRIKVSSNHEMIITELEDYFRSFSTPPQPAEISISVYQAEAFNISETFIIKEPDPGKTKIKEEYLDVHQGRIVRKRLTGMVFIFGEGVNLAIGPCLDNMNQVVNSINNRYIEWQLCRGALLGHASGVALNDSGLAVAGFSGAGKSTLALHLMDHGMTFISNDRLMIRKHTRGLSMFGVAKQPRINPGTALNSPKLIHLVPDEQRQQFSALTPEALWKVENKYDVPIEACYGSDLFHLKASMIGLVILNWKPGNGGGLNVNKISDVDRRAALLEAFIKPTGLFFYPDFQCDTPMPCVENYLSYLSDTDIWEFSGSVDFEGAAQQCLSVLRQYNI